MTIHKNAGTSAKPTLRTAIELKNKMQTANSHRQKRLSILNLTVCSMAARQHIATPKKGTSVKGSVKNMMSMNERSDSAQIFRT